MSTTHTLPTFTHISAVDADPVMRRHDAAAQLNISYERLVKLIGAGLIPEPIPTLTIRSLAGRPFLAAHGGELTVLRTGARTAANDSTNRPHIGAHIDYDNPELDATALGWWRSDPERVLRNRLFVETVSTYPFAVWDIDEHLGSRGEDTDLRHHYAGQLLARLRNRDNPIPDDEAIIFAMADEQTVVTSPTALQRSPLVAAAQKIMTSRIRVDSGGPIGYLEPEHTT